MASSIRGSGPPIGTGRSGTRSPTDPGAEVAVIGAGAVGMTLAGRLAQYGVRVEIFEQQPSAERAGSRPICMQRETLEIWARPGIGVRIAERRSRWRAGL